MPLQDGCVFFIWANLVETLKMFCFFVLAADQPYLIMIFFYFCVKISHKFRKGLQSY